MEIRCDQKPYPMFVKAMAGKGKSEVLSFLVVIYVRSLHITSGAEKEVSYSSPIQGQMQGRTVPLPI